MNELVSLGIFETIMLVCFGASWPMSIIKTVQAKNPVSKSFAFLWLIIVGYIAGSINKWYNNMDYVFFLYILNTIMVSVDLGLSYYYRQQLRKKASQN